MMKINNKVKNILLFLTFVIGNIPRIFFGSTERLNLSLLVERSTRIDFFAMYYVNAINFMILAFCLYNHKGIDKRISKFILIVTVLDFLHLLLFGMKGFGMAKIGLAIIIYWVINQINFLYNDKNKIPS